MRHPFIPLVLALALTAGAATAQAPLRTGAQPQVKGVFEPVSYPEDLDLHAVYFVNADVGWAAGDAGTIIHTTNGGAKWTAQVGGDPANKADAITMLRFLDERHGWAVQGRKLLATRDGESWEEIGTLPYTVGDVAFTSKTTGVLSAGADIYSRAANTIYRTTDGGRTWKPVWACAAKVQVGGLSRNLACQIEQIQFVTRSLAYAVARNKCTGPGCEPPPLIARTTDGGLTWETMMGPGVEDQDGVTSIFFLDPRTGFARLSSRKLHMTTDGGATWRGIVASPGKTIRFADPGVGWGIELRRMDGPISFTTDGGTRWTARDVRFPATTSDFSFPRRDRAYVVGEHGMVFRYRVVPASQPVGPNAIILPAMPGFDSPLDEQVGQLEKAVSDLATTLGVGGASGGTVTSAGTPATSGDAVASDAGDGATPVTTEALETPLPPPSTFTAQCCKKNFSQLEVILGALSRTLPEFIGKYRNLNLLLAAVRMGAELPGEYRQVREGLGSFRKAENKEDAVSALASVSAALSAFKQTTSISMQQQLPPAQP